LQTIEQETLSGGTSAPNLQGC